MKVSYNWLKEYINTDCSPEEIAGILTNTGIEVEGVTPFQSIKGGLEGIVIGEVKTCKKHPNADNLSVATVDTGEDTPLNIVCGAPNVKPGQKVPVATIGTTLYKGEESLTIKKTKLRGELSEGMICAEDEIGLGDNHEGIMVLDPGIEPGTLAKDHFNIEDDIVFEVDLTPNRIDAASHYGIARDLAAYLLTHGRQATLLLPGVNNFKTEDNSWPVKIDIQDAQACNRYAGVTISGVKICESPAWLSNRLKAVGLKPINNVVDITNYVLYETGQPLHAFDTEKIKGNTIIVKKLPDGTHFTTLDEEKRKLSGEDLMICNAEDGMAIAGVFGGIDSGVTSGTKNIFIESAYFNPVSIRKTSKRHGLNTDASYRFERGVDPEMTIYALKRAAILIKELAGGKISSSIIDEYPQKLTNHKVTLTDKHTTRLIGEKIERNIIKKILHALGIRVINENKENMKLEVPAYRVDVTREVDVIEEILRIYGYNTVHIPEKISSTLSYREKPDVNHIQNQVADFLCSNGFNEIMSNSLTPSAYYKEIKSHPEDNLVYIFNPLSTELDALRQNLLFGGLEAIAFNINRNNTDLRLFEIGNCYAKNNAQTKDPLDKYNENKHLALFMHGNKAKPNWATKEEKVTFFDLKKHVEHLLKKLSVDETCIQKSQLKSDIFSYALEYKNEKPVAVLGQVHPDILKKFDIKEEVFYADLHIQNIISIIKTHKTQYTEIPKYPEVKRDLALLLDKKVTFGDVRDLALAVEKDLIRDISLFDVYESDNIGKDKKSYAISLVFQDKNKTLTDKQVDKIIEKLIRSYKEKLNAEIR